MKVPIRGLAQKLSSVIVVATLTTGLALAKEVAHPKRVSIVALIASAEAFDQADVKTSGYVVVEDELSALFLSQLDGDHVVVENAIWLSLSGGSGKRLELLSGSYVVLEGKFSAREKGPMGMFAGSISDVTKVAVLPGSDSRNHLAPPLP